MKTALFPSAASTATASTTLPPAIDYKLIRRPRRRTVAIVVRPDCTIDVLAPPYVALSDIECFIVSKQQWISRKLQRVRDAMAQVPSRSFVNGEQFRLLEKTFYLSIRRGRHHVWTASNRLIVSIPGEQPDVENIKRAIVRWYRQQAEEHFVRRVAQVSDQFSSQIGKQPKSVGIKNYQSRWGSCHHDGRIYFNWRLMMAPEQVVDYVIVHELCHLIESNHSRNFWQLVESISPDYRDAEAWLKANGMKLTL